METNFTELDRSYYSKGIKMLEDRRKKYILLQGDYVEEWKLFQMKKLVFFILMAAASSPHVVFWKKNIVFHGKNLKLTKNNTFNNVFYNRVFPYYRLLIMFWKWLNFHKLWITFRGKYFLQLHCFQFLK